MWLRENLLRLGPTFIKLGQQARPPLALRRSAPRSPPSPGLDSLPPFLTPLLPTRPAAPQFSTRVDVLAPELVQELEKLQDRVPPFSSDKARLLDRKSVV